MAYNAAHPTLDSEHIISNTEPKVLSMGNKNIDYINDWINNVTLENEIWRGKKLREEKPLPTKRKHEYDVVNIDVIGSSCNENQRHRRKGHRKLYKVKPSPKSPRPRSPCLRLISASNAYPRSKRILKRNAPQIKPKKQNKCSMRIAELAVPTKRQFIDTWRNKSYILPEFMVDRLKQHVLDQRPIVKIPEAINCFQRRKPPTSKNCRFTQNKNENNYGLSKPLRCMDTRALCIMFGHKIAKRLSTRLNLTLNSKLANLSRIVASDIAQLTTYCHNKNCVENCKNELFLTEVSEKITVWIADVLEDLSLKLLEEDLRVIKENEAKAKTAEQLVTVMEKVLRQEQKVKSTDLEEEEGPVLDFIDDLVDNVVNICEPEPVYIEEESESSESSKDEIMVEESANSVTPTESTENIKTMIDQIFDAVEAITDTETPLTEETKDVEEAFSLSQVLSDTEHFRKEINNLIDNIIEENGDGIIKQSRDDISKESENDVSKELEDDIGKESEDNLENEIEKDTNQENAENDENSDNIDGRSIGSSEKIIQNDKKEVGANNAEKNVSNVSEVFELFTEDSGDDKNSKTVKFSVTDLVNPDKITALIKPTTVEKSEFDEQEETIRNTNINYIRPDIIFAEPNEDLLSDADETWPADISDRPLLKLSGSASKSVISLGNIIENEEKQFSSIADESHVKQNTGDTKLQEKGIIDKIENILPSNNNIENQINEELTKVFKETTTASPKTSETKVDLKTLDQNTGDDRNLIDTKTIDVKLIDKHLMVSNTDEELVDKSSKQQKQKTNTRKIGLNKDGDTAIVSERTEDGKIPTHKSQSQIDYGWKVHPKTAPSWVTSWGHERGEPSEDSIPIQKRPIKARESDIRKWCKDLEKAYINLELWSNWIESTCKETGFLLNRKENKYAGYSKKSVTDWIRLKKNINKDAILWTKLYQRTEDKFKTLRRKYHDVEYSSKKPKSGVHKAIFETMSEFESLSVVLHRMIVSAEFCALCTCNKKTKTRKNINTDYQYNITK